ncbi:hypothetical protein DFH06DRAFT_982295 [Mycena polygramma]|nr:hypothetical protein DFH06DRAFT_982295 [Mycena polygramma]
MSIQSATKRKRAEPERSTELWFHDGSVVLQAENTQFRVHWSVLSIRSPVFRDHAQTLCEPPECDIVDGCPCIIPGPATPDVAIILRALYLAPPVSTPTRVAIPHFSVVAAFVRLGRKYEFKDLFSSAIARLEYYNPNKSSKYVENPTLSPLKYFGIARTPGILFEILSLAREHGILSVLPSAYYRVVSKHSQILKGIPGPDDTVITLSSKEQQICILARPKIIRAQFEPGATFGGMFDDDWGIHCCDAECQDARPKYQRDLLLRAEVRALRPLDFQEEYWKSFGKLCSDCVEQAMEGVPKGMPSEKIWQALPSFFDLPPWDQLTNNV